MKNVKSKLLTLAALTGFVFALSGCGTSVPGGTTDSSSNKSADNGKISGTITMNGSTSMEKVVKAINGAFTSKYPDVTIELNLTGSGTGIQEAMEGKIDIGNSSRKLKDDETGLVATQICTDGIAIIVNNSNSVDDISIEQLEKIYSREITNWSDVGGPDKSIVVIGREDGSGTRDGFESIVMKNSEADYAQELESTGSVISTVGTTDGAIGYVSLANVDDTVKAVKIDGVTPNEETVKDGSFPIQRPFLCVVKEGNDSELIKAYLEFALSEEGQTQAENAGAVPVK